MGIHSTVLIIVMICIIGLSVLQKQETDKLRNEQARILEQIKVRQEGQNAMNEELASRTISLDNKLKELQNAIDDMK